MKLSQKIAKFIEKETLFQADDKLLVAVSGGIDSMVLLDILQKLNYKLGVAHVNFRLRGEDADQDEILVKNYSLSQGISYHSYVLSDEELDDLKKGNLQDEARKKRYKWFYDLLSEHQYQFICTAHHANDQAETFLFRSFRGSGLHGLTGIAAKNNQIRRPLLNTYKSDIVRYATENQINFRQDISNIASDYDRNYIRNHIIPDILRRFPNALHGMNHSLDLLKDQSALLDHLIAQEASKWRVETEFGIKLGPIDDLYSLPGHRSLLFKLIQPLGFNRSILNDMIQEAPRTGSVFYSPTHRAVINRDYIDIAKLDNPDAVDINIMDTGSYSLPQNGILKITRLDDCSLTHDSLTEYVDADKISFPLNVRTYRDGDRFYPLGMSGKSKKLSDYFADNKFGLFQKEKTLLLTTHDQIIWIIGMRLDERFKVGEKTRSYLQLRFIPGQEI